MGMGVVSDEDFNAQLENTTATPPKPQVISGEVITPKELGRGVGNIEVPDALRKIIGETHSLEGRSEGVALAKEFGISPSSADAYAHGATSESTYNKPNESLQKHILDARARVVKRARGRLMAAMGHMTEEKLAASKAIDLAGIAKDMTVVIKNMEPPDPKNTGNGAGGATFVFYAPRVVKEDNFEVIEVSE